VCSPFSIRIGNSQVVESESEKLLGLRLSNDLRWDQHVNELKSSINLRIANLRRVSYHIPHESLRTIAFGLVLSKIRYGIAVYGSVRKQVDDPLCKNMSILEVSINDTMRVINGSRRSDKVPIVELRQETKIPSANQMAAEATLLEAWKMRLNNENFNLLRPLTSTGMVTRGQVAGSLEVPIGGRATTSSFSYQATKLWNSAPIELRKCESTSNAKKIIRAFVSALPCI